MWGFLLGVYIVYIIYPFFEEWRQHRADRKRLADMRKHSKWVIAGMRKRALKITASGERVVR